MAHSLSRDYQNPTTWFLYPDVVNIPPYKLWICRTLPHMTKALFFNLLGRLYVKFMNYVFTKFLKRVYVIFKSFMSYRRTYHMPACHS